MALTAYIEGYPDLQSYWKLGIPFTLEWNIDLVFEATDEEWEYIKKNIKLIIPDEPEDKSGYYIGHDMYLIFCHLKNEFGEE